MSTCVVQWRTEGGRGVWGGGSNPPPQKKIRKSLPNCAKLNSIVKTVKIAQFRTSISQYVRKKFSETLKLLPVYDYFASAVTNKLVVIINSLKLPKVKKILVYEIKFLVTNYRYLQNP